MIHRLGFPLNVCQMINRDYTPGLRRYVKRRNVGGRMKCEVVRELVGWRDSFVLKQQPFIPRIVGVRAENFGNKC